MKKEEINKCALGSSRGGARVVCLQSEDLWRVSRLDAEALALPGVTCDDGKVCACNSEDGSAILCVGIELSLLWLGE